MERHTTVIYLIALSSTLLCMHQASATLLGRGAGFVYDDVLNVTWSRNASLPGGSDLTWAEANAWADKLVIGGFDDWRLPHASGKPGGGPVPDPILDCRTTPELACRDNEIGYMFYYNLRGTYGRGLTGNQIALGGQQILGIQVSYWATVADPAAIDPRLAVFFGFGNGLQGRTNLKEQLAGWAVRDGDVAAIPEPTSFLLLVIGLLGLGRIRRNAGRTSAIG